jgi:hypothetical protein
MRPVGYQWLQPLADRCCLCHLPHVQVLCTPAAGPPQRLALPRRLPARNNAAQPPACRTGLARAVSASWLQIKLPGCCDDRWCLNWEALYRTLKRGSESCDIPATPGILSSDATLSLLLTAFQVQDTPPGAYSSPAALRHGGQLGLGRSHGGAAASHGGGWEAGAEGDGCQVDDDQYDLDDSFLVDGECCGLELYW